MQLSETIDYPADYNKRQKDKLIMKTKLKILMVSLALVFTFSGCSTWGKLNDTEKGAVIGGGTGVVVGNIVAPGVGGTVVGGALGAAGGGLIGHEVDKDKRD